VIRNGRVVDSDWEAFQTLNTAPNAVIKLIATAGSGKTAALEELMVSHPQYGRYLYLVFNNSVQEEFETRFADSRVKVTALTLHKLALVNAKSWKNCKLRLDDNTLRVTAEDCGGSKDRVDRVRRGVKAFMSSADDVVSSKHCDASLVSYVQGVWNRLADPHSGPQTLHNVYLKVFQLDKQQQYRTFQHYYTILLDEAHDLTDCQISIITNATHRRRVFVYDPHQVIYQFRGVKSSAALDAIDACGNTCKLRHTFRFGEPLAKVVVQAVRFYKYPQHQDFNINTMPDKRTDISVVPVQSSQGGGVESIYTSHVVKAGKQLTVLARSNRGLFEEMGVCVNTAGIKLICVQGNSKGNSSSYLGTVGTFLKLKAGIQMQWGKNWYSSLDALKQHFMDEVDLANVALVEFVEESNHQSMSSLLQQIQRVSVRANSVPPPQVIFYTTHRSKGLDWDHVYLAGDYLFHSRGPVEALKALQERGQGFVADLVDKAMGLGDVPSRARRTLDMTITGNGVRNASKVSMLTSNEWSKIRGSATVEEINILYVAMTRAKKHLFVHQTVWDLLRVPLIKAGVDVDRVRSTAA
jgi:F-box protein 18 (helicase)